MSDRETSFVDDLRTDRPTEIPHETNTRDGVQGSVLDIFLYMLRWKGFLIRFVLGSAFLAVVVALLWPKSYTSTTKIMPPQQQQSSLASAILGQMGSLASLTGSNLGLNKSATEVYLYMLRSRTVADDLVDRFSLMSVYKEKRRTDAREDLRAHTDITSGPEGGISISVVDHDPNRASEIANAYVDELKNLTRTLAVTEAGRRRIFFEHEVQQAMDDLSKAELGMKKTQEQTGILMLEPQSKALLEGLAGLHAQVAVKEAQVQAMRSFATDENPDLKRAESELAALRTELSRLESGKIGSSIADIDMRKIPEKGLAYVRALRELKYREAVYEAMTKQYEIARVDEAKDAAIIQVLDKAAPAEIRSSPKRGLIVLTTAMISLILGTVLVLIAERTKSDRLLRERLKLVKLQLRRRR